MLKQHRITDTEHGS